MAKRAKKDPYSRAYHAYGAGRITFNELQNAILGRVFVTRSTIFSKKHGDEKLYPGRAQRVKEDKLLGLR